MIKAQVLAGGRGKGRFDSGLQGGVQVVFSSVFLSVFIIVLLLTPQMHHPHLLYTSIAILIVFSNQFSNCQPWLFDLSFELCCYNYFELDVFKLLFF